MLQEFKDFISRGNVIDLAIAVVIGAAFGKIITSLVDDIIMPPIGLLLGGVDFSNLFINLGDGTFASLAEAQAAGAPTINYGVFFNVLIQFLIIAFVIFLMIRQINSMQAEEPAPEPTTRECPYCLNEVPLAATRCSHCTSELVAVAPAKVRAVPMPGD